MWVRRKYLTKDLNEAVPNISFGTYTSSLYLSVDHRGVCTLITYISGRIVFSDTSTTWPPKTTVKTYTLNSFKKHFNIDYNFQLQFWKSANTISPTSFGTWSSTTSYRCTWPSSHPNYGGCAPKTWSGTRDGNFTSIRKPLIFFVPPWKRVSNDS